MIFPIYIFFIIIAVALLAAAIAAYLLVYKRHINRALLVNKGQSTMMAPPYKVATVLTIAVLVIGIIISYFIGYQAAYRYFYDNEWVMAAADIQCFYAEVQAVGENSILVEGNSLNEKKYRGEFSYDVWGEVSIIWNDTAISLSDINIGDRVSITLVTDRTGITDIFKIQLLDDEM